MGKLQIISDPSMVGRDEEIRIYVDTRANLGVVVGQMLAFRVGDKELCLRVEPHQEDRSNVAFVSPDTFKSISKKEPEFTVPDITLGCDPEFFILKHGRIQQAWELLAGKNPIGSDGTLAELRPTYSTNAQGVCDNIGSMVSQITDSIGYHTGRPADNALSFEAHSSLHGVAAGFHVHLGLPPEIIATGFEYSNVPLTQIVRCLDWYVSSLVILLDPDTYRRTTPNKNNYGMPGDYRVNNITLEYRVPGAFSLRSPQLTGGLLGLSMVVAEYMSQGIKSLTDDYRKLRSFTLLEANDILKVPESRVIRGCLMDGSKSLALRAYDKVRSTIEALPTYDKHSEVLGAFFRTLEEGRIPDSNLISNWS